MTSINLVHAKIKRVLVTCDTPSQIDVDEMYPSFQKRFTQTRKHKPHQMIALGLHVTKS
jgi:hypothetical protein